MNRTTWTRFVIIFAMLFPGLGALGYFVFAQDQWLRIIYGFSKAVQFSLPAIWCFIVLKESFKPNKPNRFSILSGLKTGLALLTLTLLTYFFVFEPIGLLAGSSQLITQKISEFGVSTAFTYFIMAIYISALHSFLEEYYWRWFVYKKLREFMDLKAAILLSSVGFTLHHVVVINHYAPATHSLVLMLLATLSVFAAGVIWAIQYERTRNLWSVWISHLLVDAALMIVGYRLVFTT